MKENRNSNKICKNVSANKLEALPGNNTLNLGYKWPKNMREVKESQI